MLAVLLRKIFCLAALILAGALVAFPAPEKKSSAKIALAAPADDDTENELPDGPEDLPGENFSAKWPTVTRLADTLPARTVQAGPDAWIYETRHFRFIADAPIALGSVKEIARIFEGTYTANLALPLNSPCTRYQVCDKGKFRAFLFEKYEKYLAAGGIKGSAGVFIGRGSGMENGAILVPFDSLGLEKRGNRYFKSGRRIDAKTLSHEITHHMTVPGSNFPTWFAEGLAEYVGLSYDGNGQVRFSGNKTVIAKFVGAYGEKGTGGRGIGKNPKVGTSLRSFLSAKKSFLGDDNKNTQIGYGVSALLVYYFFHLDGKRDAARAKRYIAALQKGAAPAAAAEELLGGRTWSQLEKDICRRLKSALKIEPEFAPAAD